MAHDEESSLIPSEPKWRWVVTSSEPDQFGQQLHRLLYGKQKLLKGSSPNDLRRFRELADHYNKRGLKPLNHGPKCKADRNLPAPPKRKPAEAPESDACDVPVADSKTTANP